MKKKNDEYYTRLIDIDTELKHYKKYFKDKVIYCNCDDFRRSNFVKYFKDNFNEFQLKKLIASGYDIESREGVGVCYYMKENQLIEEIIECNGDYRENVELFNSADIIITNPPFSLLKDFLKFIQEKKFVIIGDINTICTKDIFPHFVSGYFSFGFSNTQMYYEVPANHTYTASYNAKKVIDNKKVCMMPCARWITNLDIWDKEPLLLIKKYTEDEFPKYDNYDAIECKNIKDIPCDYDGVIGVPISFMAKYNRKQFKLVDFLNVPVINGREVYKRVMIRRVKDLIHN